MTNQISTHVQQQLLEFIEAVISGSAIIAVYIFGSTLTVHSKTESDIDIAVLLDEEAYKADPVAAMAPAYLAVTRAGMALEKKTDVSILNSASLEMAYEVVASGRCILETDSEKRLNYEIAIRGMYFDFKPFLDQLRTNCINAL
jgi:predicted nucleotidyltransferase